MRQVWLALALVPFLAFAAVDAWMHERARRVPMVEQCLHAGLAATVTAFLVSVFADRTTTAWVALSLFVGFLAADELGFHRGIDRKERSIHVASWVALGGFVFVWRVASDRP